MKKFDFKTRELRDVQYTGGLKNTLQFIAICLIFPFWFLIVLVFIGIEKICDVWRFLKNRY